MAAQAAAIHALIFWASPPELPLVTPTVTGAITPTISMASASSTVLGYESSADIRVTGSELMLIFLGLFIISFIPLLLFASLRSSCDWYDDDLFRRQTPTLQVPATRSLSSVLISAFNCIRRLFEVTVVFKLCLIAWFVHCIRRELVYPYSYGFNDCVLIGARFGMAVPLILLFRNRQRLIADVGMLFRYSCTGIETFFIGCRNAGLRTLSTLYGWCGRGWAFVVNGARSAASMLARVCEVTWTIIFWTIKFVFWTAPKGLLTAIWALLVLICLILATVARLIYGILGWTVRTAIIYWPSLLQTIVATYLLTAPYIRQYSEWRWNLFLARFRDVLEVLGNASRKFYLHPTMRLAAEVASNKQLRSMHRRVVEEKDERIGELVECKNESNLRVEDLEGQLDQRKNTIIWDASLMLRSQPLHLQIHHWKQLEATTPEEQRQKQEVVDGLEHSDVAGSYRYLDVKHRRLEEDSAKKDKEFTETIKGKDAELKGKDVELKAKDAAMKVKNTEINAKDAEDKAKDGEIRAKDAKIKEQDALLQRHELREKDSAATNEALANDLKACRETSCVWQAQVEGLRQELAARPDSSDAERRVIDNVADQIVKAQNKAEAAEKKAKQAMAELQTQKDNFAQLSAQYDAAIKENEECHNAKVDLEDELARVKALIPVDEDAMDEDILPAVISAVDGLSVYPVRMDCTDDMADSLSISITTTAFPITQFSQEEYGYHCWLMNNPNAPSNGCDGAWAKSGGNGSKDGHNLSMVTTAFDINLFSQEEYAYKCWLMNNPNAPSSGCDGAWAKSGGNGQGTADKTSIDLEALAKAKYAEKFPKGHKGQTESRLNHYLGNFEAVEESMKAQGGVVPAAKALRILFEAHRDEINTGLKDVVDNGPLTPQQLANLLQIWGRQHGIEIQLGFVADIQGGGEHVVHLVGLANQASASQTVFLYKSVSEGTKEAFLATPWRALRPKMVVGPGKKPGTKPSPLSNVTNVDGASQEPSNANASDGNQPIPDFDENDIVNPAAAAELSTAERDAMAEQKFQEAFPYGHKTDTGGPFCSDPHESAFAALNESFKRQQLGVRASTNLLIKSYDKHHGLNALPKRDKGKILTPQQLCQFLLLWGDDRGKVLVLGVVIDIPGQKPRLQLAPNFDHTQKDQKIIWVCKELINESADIDGVVWKGLAKK